MRLSPVLVGQNQAMCYLYYAPLCPRLTLPDPAKVMSGLSHVLLCLSLALHPRSLTKQHLLASPDGFEDCVLLTFGLEDIVLTLSLCVLRFLTLSATGGFPEYYACCVLLLHS